MFGKLFGRSRRYNDSMFNSSQPAPSNPAVQAAEAAGAAPTGQIDLAALLHTVQEAREHAGGDRMKLAAELQQTLGATVANGGVFTMGANGLMPFAQTDSVSGLERLAKLHADGALTDTEFALEKAKLIGPGT